MLAFTADVRGLLRRGHPSGWGEHGNHGYYGVVGTAYARLRKQGVRVGYLTYKSAQPSGKTVVICHGFTANAAVMGPLAMALVQRGFDVVSVDMPGHGRSAWIPGMTYIETAKVVLMAVRQAVTEANLASQLTFLGHSHGGGVVAAAASELGDEVERYVLLASVGGPAWTEMMVEFDLALTNFWSGRRLTQSLMIGSELVVSIGMEGFFLLPPLAEVVGFAKELVIPVMRGRQPWGRLHNQYSVMRDTILADAAALEGYLAIMGELSALTVCLVGEIDGVVTAAMIDSQAPLAHAVVVKAFVPHAFMVPPARRWVADRLTETDQQLYAAAARKGANFRTSANN